MDFSYQLYSARNEKSLDDTLKTLKSLGYSQVEGLGRPVRRSGGARRKPQGRGPDHADRAYGLHAGSRIPPQR